MLLVCPSDTGTGTRSHYLWIGGDVDWGRLGLPDGPSDKQLLAWLTSEVSPGATATLPASLKCRGLGLAEEGVLTIER